jgi:methylmalonyl-CoA carboxyltransferase 5S subunit
LGEKDSDVVAKAAIRANRPAITCRPADLLRLSWERVRTEAMALGCNGSDEDILTYAMFPKAAAKFFQTRTAGPKEVSRELSEAKSANKPVALRSAGNKAEPGQSHTYIISISGAEHTVTVTPAQ